MPVVCSLIIPKDFSYVVCELFFPAALSRLDNYMLRTVQLERVYQIQTSR